MHVVRKIHSKKEMNEKMKKKQNNEQEKKERGYALGIKQHSGGVSPIQSLMRTHR